MTGSEVRAIRTRLDLTVAQLADLLGTAQSTAYRWEACERQVVAIEPGHARLLSLMQRQIDAGEAGALAKKLAEGVLIGGGLRTLYILLDSVYGRHR